MSRKEKIDERWVGPAEGLEAGLRHSEMHEQMARDEGKWQEKALAGAIQMGQVESSPAILRKVLALSDGSTGARHGMRAHRRRPPLLDG